MEKQRETIVFEGVEYHRFPDSPNKHQRRYYWPERGSGKDALHREVWKSANGPIPDGWHIHHIDEDTLNNDPANLEALSPGNHTRIHADDYRAQRQSWVDEIRPLASAWHQSDQGRAWHSEKARKDWEGREPEHEVQCAHCGKLVQTYWADRGDTRYCSRKCHRAAADAAKRYTVEAECPICGKQFWQSRYRAKPETCSRICGAALRKRRSM